MSPSADLVAAYQHGLTRGTTLITAPTQEPVSLERAKRHLRVTRDDENEDIAQLIPMARKQVERDTGRALMTQTHDLVCDTVPAGRMLQLPFAPLISVTLVTSYDIADAATVMASTDYQVDVSATPGRLTLKSSASWPTSLREYQSLVVRFVCGYGANPEDVPEPLAQAMLLLIGGFFEHREHVIISQFAGQFLELPVGYKSLIAGYTVWG
jgi:uncharacterized phiE125 gp8 family phage protein